MERLDAVVGDGTASVDEPPAADDGVFVPLCLRAGQPAASEVKGGECICCNRGQLHDSQGATHYLAALGFAALVLNSRVFCCSHAGLPSTSQPAESSAVMPARRGRKAAAPQPAAQTKRSALTQPASNPMLGTTGADRAQAYASQRQPAESLVLVEHSILEDPSCSIQEVGSGGVEAVSARPAQAQAQPADSMAGRMTAAARQTAARGRGRGQAGRGAGGAAAAKGGARTVAATATGAPPRAQKRGAAAEPAPSVVLCDDEALAAPALAAQSEMPPSRTSKRARSATTGDAGNTDQAPAPKAAGMEAELALLRQQLQHVTQQLDSKYSECTDLQVGMTVHAAVSRALPGGASVNLRLLCLGAGATVGSCHAASEARR